MRRSITPSHLLLLACAAAAATTAFAAEPKAIYQGTCIACHGPAARGAIPGVPDLVKTGRLDKPTATLVANILSGVQTPGSPLAMPPKGGMPNLTPADAEGLVTYMRALRGK